MARPSCRSQAQADFRSFSFPKGMDVKGELTIQPTETNAEREHRHRMEVRRFWVEDAPVHVAAIGIVIFTTALALFMASRPGNSIDEKKWAVSILTYLPTAVAGFAFGKKAAK